jgi:hypothetical protein
MALKSTTASMGEGVTSQLRRCSGRESHGIQALRSMAADRSCFWTSWCRSQATSTQQGLQGDYAVFFQDDKAGGDATLNLGVRYDLPP